jgi:uncharacterized membrane protein YtjA (UPF0391 family)
VAHLAQDLMEFSSKHVANAVEKIGEMLSALLGADKPAKPVEKLLEQVGAMVADLAQALGTLLGGGGTPGPDGKLLEQVGAVVANLARGLGNALGWMLAGGGDVPYPASNSMAQTLLAFYGLPDRAAELLERSGAALADLAQATGGALGTGGSQHLTHKPFAPPVAPVPVAPPLPVPVAPGGPAPASSFFGGASATSAGAIQLPFAMLVLFSVALLQGGRLSRLRRESHGPPTALVLAIERPG